MDTGDKQPGIPEVSTSSNKSRKEDMVRQNTFL